MIVAIAGASANPERFAHRAQKKLADHGHEVVPVSPSAAEILGVASHARLADIDRRVHTVTLYLNPARQATIADDLLALAPQRVIFNPGTENPALRQRLESAGIAVVEACTLVLLDSGRFETAGLKGETAAT